MDDDINKLIARTLKISQETKLEMFFYPVTL